MTRTRASTPGATSARPIASRRSALNWAMVEAAYPLATDEIWASVPSTTTPDRRGLGRW